MNRSSFAVVLAALALPALALPAAAFAQQAATPGHDVAARVEQRLTQLHGELAITPAEEAAWSQYAQTVRANAQGMSQMFATRRTTLASMNAADNVQSLTDMAAQHAQNMQRLDAAFRQLYAAMPAAQQAAADRVLRSHSVAGSRQ